jgi:hypothetical protein
MFNPSLSFTGRTFSIGCEFWLVGWYVSDFHKVVHGISASDVSLRLLLLRWVLTGLESVLLP